MQLSDLVKALQAAYHSGRVNEVETLAGQVLDQEPGAIPVLVMLGAARHKSGNSAAALTPLKLAVELDPKAFEAWVWLSMAYRSAGQEAEAVRCAERALDLRPDDPAAIYNMGMCLHAVGSYRDALPHLQEAKRRRPNDIMFNICLSVTLGTLGWDHEAETALKDALKQSPFTAQVLLSLGQLALSRDETVAAVDYGRRTLASNAGSGEAHLLLAKALLDSDHAEARIHMEQAEAVDPDLNARSQVAQKLQSLGRFAEAEATFKEALAAKPKQGLAYFGLVSAKKVNAADQPLVEAMEAEIGRQDLPPHERIYLEYALGKARDNLGEFVQAIRHFDEANRQAKETWLGGHQFHRESFTRLIDQTIKTFTFEFIAENRRYGSPSSLPIFIVGMIRSGTTLVEQILSSHPEVGATGEQRLWYLNAPACVDLETGQLLPDNLAPLVSEYLGLLSSIAPGKFRATDKNPGNILLAGLIAIAFPKAHIILTRRDAIDTCLSIWMTPNATPPAFACDRESITFAYEEFLRLAAHWRTVLPAESLFEIQYEELVMNRERNSRELVGFCGLEWDDRCLHPEANLRTVSTPSYWQVRQPLYTSSIGRRRDYEPWLGPFKRLEGR